MPSLNHTTLETHNQNAREHPDDVVSSTLDRADNALLQRPILFAAVVVISLALLPVAVWLDLRHISGESLMRQASDLNSMISQIRRYYATNVVARVLESHGKAIPSHDYEVVSGGIPIPATLSIEMGNVIGSAENNVQYRFVSDLAFSGRRPHNLSAFEKMALEKLRASNSQNATVTDFSGSHFRREISMAVPVVMGTACISCHNAHPESPKRDWKVGDIRGIQSITVAQPIAENILSFKYLLIYLVGAGGFGIVFSALQWRQAKRFSRLNGELEEANSFLAAISMKISKYLSPQVYKSIFSGEKDVVISTERKKLTIFFSDIKDFTVSTERLQPEELTGLLNEYFTEMERIARAHGATVDKFIGDAILVFFGDPETRGAREDAHACLEMALEMQQRLAELNREWRDRGIEKPFEARMGINTGYCNVGNFGSEDRMDYTIIGAEANLAARLQAIAEPGGIVMSYETYALVSDRVKVLPLDPITLKGISRKVIPYAVEGTNPPDGVVIEKNIPRLKLLLDLTELKKEERKEIEIALDEALAAVRSKRAKLS